MKFAFFAILPDPRLRKILALREQGHWRLPQFVVETPSFKWPGPMNAVVTDWLHTPVTVRRYLHNLATVAATETWAIVFDMQAALPSPPYMSHWLDLEALSEVSRETPDLEGLLKDWLAEADPNESVPRGRPRWYRRGWWPLADTWVTQQLDGAGIQRSGAMVQLKWGVTAAVLQVPTTTGPLFFKATAQLLGREAQLTHQLAEYSPDLVPALVAVHEQHNWLLMRELPGRRLADCTALAGWERAMQGIARLQIQAAPLGTRLLEWGCADRRVARLPSAYYHLLDELQAPHWQQVYNVTPDDLAQLHRSTSIIERWCVQLENIGVPDSLGHGDLHAGNIMVEDETITIFDWTAGALTHPFFDLLTLIGEGGGPRGNTHAPVIERLVQSYLAPWCEQYDRESVMAAFAVSQHLAPLAMALIYRQITRGIEPNAWWEWSADVGAYLHMLLDRTSHALPA